MISVYCVAQSLPLPAVRVVQVALAWRRPFRVLKRKKVRRKYRNIADVQFETILKLELYLQCIMYLSALSLYSKDQKGYRSTFVSGSTLVICYCNSTYQSTIFIALIQTTYFIEKVTHSMNSILFSYCNILPDWIIQL